VVLAPTFTGGKITLGADPTRGWDVAGLAVREKFTAAVWLPEVPVMVTVLVPVAVASFEVRVTTLLFPVVGVTGFGLNCAFIPSGRPVAENVTAPVKLPRLVTVMVFVPGAVGVTTTEPDEGMMKKLELVA
jgi:hypothetical protein